MLFNLDGIYKISRLFAALTNITAISFRCCPGQLLLLADRSFEKVCAVFEGFVYRGFVYAMIANVNEAGGLEARQDGFCCGLTNRGISCLEGRKVDKLAKSVKTLAQCGSMLTGMVSSSAPTAVVTVGVLMIGCCIDSGKMSAKTD